MHKLNKKLDTNQMGLVSIVVTLMIMIILSLITLGFARIIRREQRQVLDRQLSTQAFYAAEAGINDAVNALTAQNYIKNKSNCDPDTSGPLAGTSKLDADGAVKVSCLLIDQMPFDLEYTAIKTNTVTVVPLNGVDPNSSPTAPVPMAITRLEISWQTSGPIGPGGPVFASTYPNFPTASTWPATAPGVLRTALTPTAGVLNRPALVDSTFTTFLYPQGSRPTSQKGSINYISGPSNQGAIVDGKCNAANNKHCTAEIRNLSQINYMLQLRSIYSSTAVTIRAYGGSPERQLRLINAQTVVDSTGKAGDILRRLQVRLPNRNGYAYPAFALESGEDICKRLEVYPGYVGGCPATASSPPPVLATPPPPPAPPAPAPVYTPPPPPPPPPIFCFKFC